MIWTTSLHEKEKKLLAGQQLKSHKVLSFLLVIGLVGVIYYLYRMQKNRHSDEVHPYVKFEDRLSQVCANPKLPPLEYKGVQSFFKYLTSPDKEHCYSWLEFGGEKIVIPTQTENECLDEIRKSKFICFNEEYEMVKDPCLIYSFTKDRDQQFERDMHMFSCPTHVFDAEQITLGEHIQRTKFWVEHAWDIAEYPYDKEPEPASKKGFIRRRSLDYIAHTLNHEGKVINFLKSDSEGREWILLKQVITHSDLLDIRQIGVRLHLPTVGLTKMGGTERHEIFRDLFQVFQGLNCLGYKYVLGRPINYYRGVVHIPENNGSYYPAYEVNFAKVLPKNS